MNKTPEYESYMIGDQWTKEQLTVLNMNLQWIEGGRMFNKDEELVQTLEMFFGDGDCKSPEQIVIWSKERLNHQLYLGKLKVAGVYRIKYRGEVLYIGSAGNTRGLIQRIADFMTTVDRMLQITEQAQNKFPEELQSPYDNASDFVRLCESKEDVLDLTFDYMIIGACEKDSKYLKALALQEEVREQEKYFREHGRIPELNRQLESVDWYSKNVLENAKIYKPKSDINLENKEKCWA